MKWPADILEKVAPILLDADRVSKYFPSYIHEHEVPRWISESKDMRSRNEFRDFREEAFAVFLGEFDMDPESTHDSLVMPDSIEQRQSLSVKYLTEKSLELRTFNLHRLPNDFVAHCLQKELDIYFGLAKSIGHFRPILKCPRESIEVVVAKIEKLGPQLTIQNVQEFAKDLGLQTILPILALYSSCFLGDVDEMFLHPPLPRIFGNPSTRDITKTHHPDDLLKKSVLQKGIAPERARRVLTPLNILNAVVAGSGSLGYSLNGSFHIVKYARACLVCALPDVPNFVWVANPATLQAAVVRLRPSFKIIIEFDLPDSGTEEGQSAVPTEAGPNWIDCQRDVEGYLALMWGHINEHTGMMATQNMLGLDLNGANGPDLSKTLCEIPSRNTVGTKLDWRDHGNLLNVHYSVKDESTNERHWTHVYEICFGSHLLMTMSTDSRPIEAVFGSPREMFLLSPLSSTQTLQYWSLDETGTYNMVKACGLLKPDSGQWKSVCVMSV